MTYEELCDEVKSIVDIYFDGATVVWGNTEQTKPKGPFVKLTMGLLTHTQHGIEQIEDEEVYNCIPSSASLTVELFTHGRKVKKGQYTYQKNTAVSDMMDFVKFITSPYVDELCESKDIAFTAEGGVLDTSAVLDPNYEYRALQEFTVSYTDTTRGYAGISRTDWQQTPSGGGTKALADKKINDIDAGIINSENNF